MSKELNWSLIFEGIYELDDNHLLNTYLDRHSFEKGIMDVIKKGLEHDHDIEHMSQIILRHWIPSLHRFVEKKGMAYYPYDLNLEIESLLVKAGYPDSEFLDELES